MDAAQTDNRHSRREKWVKQGDGITERDGDMDEKFYEMILAEKEKREMSVLMDCNEKTARFGLSLTEQEAHELVICRNESLKKYRRVEFGGGILDKLIFTFCDSSYITQDTYKETMEELQDIFYCFKNEAADQLTDDELLAFMK